MKLKVYGSSDDLIEIEGDCREEFNHYDSSDEESSYLVFSDGTVLKVFYNSEGIWKINTKSIGLGTKVDKIECNDPSGDVYTDELTLTGEFRWVLHTSEAQFVVIKQEVK